MTLICVSNDVSDLRSCTFRDQHLANCTGLRMRGDGSSVECKGCEPRPAHAGLLCWSHWVKAEAALDQAVDAITHLRSVERGPQDQSGVRAGSSGSKVIIPESWQEADNLWEALCAVVVGYATDWHLPEPGVLDRRRVTHLDTFASIDEVRDDTRELIDFVKNRIHVASKQQGAANLIRFVNTLQTADARFPRIDMSRPLAYIRCEACQQYAIYQHPPLHYADAITAACTNCGHVYDPQMADFDRKVTVQRVIEELPPEVLEALLPTLQDDERKATRA